MFFIRGNQILLLRRLNTGYRDGEYSVPAGHLDGNETVVAAAAREAEEEIGVRIEADDIRFSSVMHRIEGMSGLISLCRSITGRERSSMPSRKNATTCAGWI